MTNIRPLPHDAPPALAPADRIQRSIRDLLREFYASLVHEPHGVVAMRDWLAHADAFLPLLHDLDKQISSMSRLATRGEIGAALLKLRETVAASRQTSAESNRNLAERVGAAQPSVGALTLAVIHLQDTLEWFPSGPVVVIRAIESAASDMSRVAMIVRRLTSERERITTELQQEEQFEAERLAWRTKVDAAEQQALREVLGDDSPETRRRLLQDGDAAALRRVQARRDELLTSQRLL